MNPMNPVNIYLAQLNYTINDFQANLQKIEDVITTHCHNADIICFSELATCGYYPYDLLYDADFMAKNEAILEKIIQLTHEYQITIIIGTPRECTLQNTHNKRYNSALVIQEGKIIHTYNKHQLPVYDIHDESRHFISADVDFENNTPYFTIDGHHFALCICEDIWTNHHITDNFMNMMMQKKPNHQKIEGLFILNASPSYLNKQNYRLALTKKIAQQLEMPIFYVNQVGGNDQIIYDGNSFILNKEAQLIQLAKIFQEDVIMVELSEDKMQSPQTPIPLHYHHDPYTFYLEQLILGLRDYMKKCNAQKVIVSSSGGIDSALTLTLAYLALGAENIYVITLPSKYSSHESTEDSKKLCQNLNIPSTQCFRYPIHQLYEDACIEFQKAFHQSTGPKPFYKDLPKSPFNPQ